MQSLVDWAVAEDSVRAALLVGSRAALSARIDALSDYDVVLFVRDRSAYERSDAWLESFGAILVQLHGQYELVGRRVLTRLVQYEDGARIDVSLCDLDLLEQLTVELQLPEMLNAGYRVLVDKDGRLSRLPAATGRAFVPRRPTEAEYRWVVNEFWWETIYVAKHLARGELLPARYSAESVLRFECLVRLLEWYVQGARGWSEPLGPHGRGVIHLLDERDRALLERSYAGADPEQNWSALFAMTELFARAARSVAGELGFTDVDALDRRVESFLRSMRAGAGG